MRFGREALTSLVFTTCVAACSSGGDDPSGTGTLTLSLMDRSVDDIAELHVTVSAMRAKPAGDGPAIDLPLATAEGEDTITVNLLELDDENPAVLVNAASVPAGAYNWIEMQIEDAEITESFAMTDAGAMMPVDVDVPSGRLRLVSGFEVADNAGVRFLFDWDVRSGLTHAVGRNVYLLRPAFRILDADEIGLVTGTVDLDMRCPGRADTDKPVIYIYEGADAVPDDIGGTVGDEPYTSADVEFDAVANADVYRTVLMPGDYTFVLVCDGNLDLDGDEDLEFLSPIDGDPDSRVVTVAADMPTESVDF